MVLCHQESAKITPLLPLVPASEYCTTVKDRKVPVESRHFRTYLLRAIYCVSTFIPARSDVASSENSEFKEILCMHMAYVHTPLRKKRGPA